MIFPQSTQFMSLLLEPKILSSLNLQNPEQFSGILLIAPITVHIVKEKLVGGGGFVCLVQAKWPLHFFLHNQNHQRHN